MNKSFIPDDKPKSFVIFTCAVLAALLIAEPMGSVKFEKLMLTGRRQEM